MKNRAKQEHFKMKNLGVFSTMIVAAITCVLSSANAVEVRNFSKLFPEVSGVRFETAVALESSETDALKVFRKLGVLKERPVRFAYNAPEMRIGNEYVRIAYPERIVTPPEVGAEHFCAMINKRYVGSYPATFADQNGFAIHFSAIEFARPIKGQNYVSYRRLDTDYVFAAIICE